MMLFLAGASGRGLLSGVLELFDFFSLLFLVASREILIMSLLPLMVKLHRASPVALEQNAQDDSVPLWIHVTSPDQGHCLSLISRDIRLWNENE
jgi:hypothetical protein